MKGYEWYLAGSLEKVFPDRLPQVMREGETVYILKGETPAVQLVYGRQREMEGRLPEKYVLEAAGFPAQARMRDVLLAPSAFPCFERRDENYITTLPGLFPDILKPKKEETVVPMPGQYRSVWIDFPDTASVPAGDYEVEIRLTARWAGREEQDGSHETAEKASAGEAASWNRTLRFHINVADVSLPEQELLHTEWFHADCVADYYQVPVFGEAHWDALEKQIGMAAELGVNMLLTPVFTPPLDTEVGGERTTVQLVGITLEGERYSFDFSLLERWCALCRKAGIRYIEIPHLFTQWGAKAVPKIVVRENGEEKKKFGWHVAADDPSYRHFLESFLPALQEKLLELGYAKDEVYFHISDEPSREHLDSYEKARSVAADLLEGWPVVDALSDFSFYEKGLVEQPVVANDHIQPFADHGVEKLWVYYCCSQCVDVPNRFFAMPSARNRIMGVLMYLYDVKGFLQWGFNFYNTQFSREHLDPFFDTHAGYAFPSGDSFLVYPGPDGTPYSSIRGQVQLEALADLGALRALEERIGRERVLEVIYEGEKAPFTFTQYPSSPFYLYELRKRISRALLINC